MSKGQELYEKAKILIPGGTQLLSKRPEMHLPNLWPSYYESAKGYSIIDLDGNTYKDFSFMGIGANVLGYCDEDIDKAVINAIKKGNSTTLNSPYEVTLAEMMTEIHPWADMVRYTKTGGESMAVAVRLARASTGKDMVLFSGYHGWHDWYLAANLSDDKALDGIHLAGLEPNGVPRGLTGSSATFEYNDLDAFRNTISTYENRIAAVIIEPIRSVYPEKGFLEELRKVTKEKGIVLIVDEISSANRLCLGGAHLLLGFEPDMAVFAKAISNGYPQGIIIGKREIMEAAQSSFISSTNWTESIGLAASIATLKKFKAEKVEKHLDFLGNRIMEGWKSTAKKNNVNITAYGIPPMSHFEFNYQNPLAYKTYFTQEMLKFGFLATTACYISYAHDNEGTDEYLKAAFEVFGKIEGIIESGQNMLGKLDSDICHSGFQRLTK